ncbi:hypothetical protein BH11VER1_BH11VER1_40090 [soil metagenome]
MKFKLIAAIFATTLLSSMSMAKAAIATTSMDRRDFTNLLRDDTTGDTTNPAPWPSMGTSAGDHSQIGQVEEMAKKKKPKKKKKTSAS